MAALSAVRSPHNSPHVLIVHAKVVCAARYGIRHGKSISVCWLEKIDTDDFQREACHAYILSQRHEGWRLVDRQYDDGGYSGGSMERPGLTRLLQDIDAGRIDTIVESYFC